VFRVPVARLFVCESRACAQGAGDSNDHPCHLCSREPQRVQRGIFLLLTSRGQSGLSERRGACKKRIKTRSFRGANAAQEGGYIGFVAENGVTERSTSVTAA
jgi:hypothetical protein